MTLVQFALNRYTNFAGNDGLNKDGDRAYSSYVEADSPHSSWAVVIGQQV